MPNLSMSEMDKLALTIAFEHRAEEPALMRSRWWDYRQMHPVAATYKFAECYQASHRTWWHRYIDTQRAEERVLWTGDLFEQRNLTAFWLARQAADRAGVPYEFLTNFALIRAFKREYRHPLQPNQLYGEEFELDLQDSWKANLEVAFLLPASDFYKTAAYKGHLLQREFRGWLIHRVNARQAPHHRLLARLLRDDFVNDDMIAYHWPEEQDRVRGYLPLVA